jgi:hypothetical protein
MARTTVSQDHSSEAKFGKRIERFRSDLDAAKSHSIGRDRRVGQVMCYLSLMRNTGIIDHRTSVTCTAAARQHFTSSRAEGKQAAHFLPGQLRLNGRFPWLLLKHQATALKLEGLFGDVEDLPADFNKADSAAEAYQSVEGLKRSFADACKIVVNHPDSAGGAKVNRTLVRLAFQDWLNRSKRAYQNALIKKKTKVNVPALKRGVGQEYGMLDSVNIRDRSNAMHRDHHYIAQVDFLKAYLEIIKPNTLTETLISAVEKGFQK